MTPQSQRIVDEALSTLESVYAAWLKARQTSDIERQVAAEKLLQIAEARMELEKC